MIDFDDYFGPSAGMGAASSSMRSEMPRANMRRRQMVEMDESSDDDQGMLSIDNFEEMFGNARKKRLRGPGGRFLSKEEIARKAGKQGVPQKKGGAPAKAGSSGLGERAAAAAATDSSREEEASDEEQSNLENAIDPKEGEEIEGEGQRKKKKKKKKERYLRNARPENAEDFARRFAPASYKKQFEEYRPINRQDLNDFWDTNVTVSKRSGVDFNPEDLPNVKKWNDLDKQIETQNNDWLTKRNPRPTFEQQNPEIAYENRQNSDLSPDDRARKALFNKTKLLLHAGGLVVRELTPNVAKQIVAEVEGRSSQKVPSERKTAARKKIAKLIETMVSNSSLGAPLCSTMSERDALFLARAIKSQDESKVEWLKSYKRLTDINIGLQQEVIAADTVEDAARIILAANRTLGKDYVDEAFLLKRTRQGNDENSPYSEMYNKQKLYIAFTTATRDGQKAVVPVGGIVVKTALPTDYYPVTTVRQFFDYTYPDRSQPDPYFEQALREEMDIPNNMSYREIDGDIKRRFLKQVLVRDSALKRSIDTNSCVVLETVCIKKEFANRGFGKIFTAFVIGKELSQKNREKGYLYDSVLVENADAIEYTFTRVDRNGNPERGPNGLRYVNSESIGDDEAYFTRVRRSFNPFKVSIGKSLGFEFTMVAPVDLRCVRNSALGENYGSEFDNYCEAQKEKLEIWKGDQSPKLYTALICGENCESVALKVLAGLPSLEDVELVCSFLPYSQQPLATCF